ncbi:MAG TPA: PilZ domain-containing protein [Pseudolabrys sp.]|nr:PilZ domain-containing protein [Pseudolabrys sp.]
MSEQRKVQRRRLLKAGSINFHRAATIDCRVRNLSPSGACLEVVSPVGIPDDFVLVINSDHLKLPCHVIWRTATRLGVEFTPSEGGGVSGSEGPAGRHKLLSGQDNR